MENNNLKRYKAVLIIAVLMLASFGFGTYFGQTGKSLSSSTVVTEGSSSLSSSTVNLDQLWTVWKILDDKFVYTHKDAKRITDQDKIWGAIEGLTSSYGDPYTVFFPPEESKNFASDISGNFEGVGMELAIKDKNIVVGSGNQGRYHYCHRSAQRHTCV